MFELTTSLAKFLYRLQNLFLIFYVYVISYWSLAKLCNSKFIIVIAIVIAVAIIIIVILTAFNKLFGSFITMSKMEV